MKELIDQWNNMKRGYYATTQEFAELITAAQFADNAHPAEWADLAGVLNDHTDFSEKEVRAEVRRCKIMASLGAYPYTVQEFIPLYLERFGFKMDFAGTFTHKHQERDLHYVLNDMNMWCAQAAGPQPVFSRELVQSAFDNWRAHEADRIVAKVLGEIAYDRDADRFELRRFAAHVTKPVEGDPVQTGKLIRATELALASFIYRIKNHMRGV